MKGHDALVIGMQIFFSIIGTIIGQFLGGKILEWILSW